MVSQIGKDTAATRFRVRQTLTMAGGFPESSGFRPRNLVDRSVSRSRGGWRSAARGDGFGSTVPVAAADSPTMTIDSLPLLRRIAICGVLALALAGGNATALFAADADEAAVSRSDPPRVALDPLAAAVVESIRQPGPTSPRGWLEGAIRAVDVDAVADAVDFYRRFVDAVAAVEANDRGDLLADLGDAIDPAGLRRLARAIEPYEPDAPNVLGGLPAAANQRRRDPQRLAAAADGLRSLARPERLAAAHELARAGVAALPTLIDVLQSTDEESSRARALARGLVHDLGGEGRDALLCWLGSDDIDRWPGVITALAAVSDEDADFLLAPAFSADAPPAARAAATQALAALGQAPTIDEARARLARRLDHALSPAGLPMADSLDPKTITTFTWDPEAGLPRRATLTIRLARAEQAGHLARDLAALGPTDPAQIRLVLLARLALTAAAAGDAPAALDAVPAAALVEALSGPEGFDVLLATDVLDEAALRDMPAAATAAARAIRLAATAKEPKADAPPAPLPPAARAALLRALAVPDPELAFEAAHTLAVCGGDPPYRGASKVVEALLYSATSNGVDRAIVAHPDPAIVEELAAGLSRHGYQTIRVRSGRDAIFAARDSADTVLVVLAARLGSPSALETVQLLQLGSQLAAPPVLVVVDPLDDDPRGRFLTRLIMAFADVECVAIVDRMESFFLPEFNPETGVAVRPPRFPEALAIAAGPRAADPQRRAAETQARLGRARIALETLALLGDRGWDISAALPTARQALLRDDLHPPAVAVLAAIGSPDAQQSLFREARQEDLPESLRSRARAGFAASVSRYGILLESGHIRSLAAMYNSATDADRRRLAGELLEILEGPRMRSEPARVDAP
jgi:hypothetical protein